MFTIENKYNRGAGNEPDQNRDEGDGRPVASSPLFEFAGNARATLAERFPHLMVCAVAVAFFLAAVAAEIECLRGSGYYWR